MFFILNYSLKILNLRLNMELYELKGFKFVTSLVIVFKITKRDDATKYSTFHSNSKAERIIIERDIDDVFESIYSKIISNIQKYIGKSHAGLLI